MQISRRDFGKLTGLGMAACIAPPAVAQAAPYPHKVVTLITHSSPGGGSDVFLREMVKFLGKYINAAFVVENVRGGSGAKAMTKLATSPADGSVFYATTPTYIYTSLLSRPPHGYDTLEPLVNFFTDAEVIYTRANGPFQSLKDVIDHARNKRGRWGAANPASLERQAAEQLKAASGVRAAVVTHEGGGDLMINVLNGTLDIGVGEIQELRSQLDGKRIRLLAVFNAARLAQYPDLPTVKELGYQVVLEKFRGLAAPKGVRPDIAAIWNAAVPKLLADPAYRKIYGEESLVPNFIPHGEYGKFIERFTTGTRSFLKSNGVIK